MTEKDTHEKSNAEQRYRSLVDDAPYTIIIVDNDKRVFVEEANRSAEKLYGLKRSEILGKLGPQDLSPEFQPDGRRSDEAALEFMQAALDEKFPTFEWMHRTAQGIDVPCEVTLSRFPDRTRNLIRASIVDLTERKRAEAKQLELERQLSHARKLETVGQMTGGVAHDFNNLLSIIMGNLELLAYSHDVNDNANALIRNALDASEKGAALTQSMLNYARQAPLQPTDFSLSEVVRKTQSMIARTIPANILIKTLFDVERWRIHADAASTESALINLVLNARDAMPEGGTLTIEVKSIELAETQTIPGLTDKPCVVLSVADTGIGIPSYAMDKIFDPFYSTKGHAKNSGMGLSMVDGFMTQSGGAVTVKSEIGRGTRVQLYFPRIDTEHALSEIPAERKSEKTKQARILMVEDQKEVLSVFKMMLELQGHEVLTAENGTDAAVLFANTDGIDLLIADIVMPGPIQGFELAMHLRKLEPQLRVIFMSGYIHEKPVLEAEKRMNDIQLMKPVSQKILLQAVHDALSSNT